jgi:hypothetical protein
LNITDKDIDDDEVDDCDGDDYNDNDNAVWRISLTTCS